MRLNFLLGRQHILVVFLFIILPGGVLNADCEGSRLQASTPQVAVKQLLWSKSAGKTKMKLILFARQKPQDRVSNFYFPHSAHISHLTRRPQNRQSETFKCGIRAFIYRCYAVYIYTLRCMRISISKYIVTCKVPYDFFRSAMSAENFNQEQLRACSHFFLICDSCKKLL